MCNRCTRVCDEMSASPPSNRSTVVSKRRISPRSDWSEGNPLHNCGMCIAVCPVGALTDRHFAHHPWELDSTETICGFCDNGCTINVESNKGVVRRATNLWERGMNHGYVCEKGKWGHELQQSPDRLRYPRINQAGTLGYEVTWDDALESIAATLQNYRGNQFAALVSPDDTNEDAYLAQKFTRAIMGTNNVDRMLTPSQVAVERSVRAALGRDVSSTNNSEEMFTDVHAAMVVGPDIGKTTPVASYWLYHAIHYREAKVVVISQDDYPLCWRAKLWLRPNDGSTGTLLKGIARQIVDLKLANANIDQKTLGRLTESLADYDLDRVSRTTGVPGDKIQAAAVLYATGGVGLDRKVENGYPSSVIFNTAAHIGSPFTQTTFDNASEITDLCNDLALLTGNFGRAGGGVATPRGPANYQGSTDMGAHPFYLPGGPRSPMTLHVAKSSSCGAQRFRICRATRWMKSREPSRSGRSKRSISRAPSPRKRKAARNCWPRCRNSISSSSPEPTPIRLLPRWRTSFCHVRCRSRSMAPSPAMTARFSGCALPSRPLERPVRQAGSSLSWLPGWDTRSTGCRLPGSWTRSARSSPNIEESPLPAWNGTA